MLSEFGLTHDVFRLSSYSHPEVCELHLKNLKRVLLDRALVRDFRDREWQRFFQHRIGEWDPRAKELLKKLVVQNRLKRSPPADDTVPANDLEWCREAIASHAQNPLDGIITTMNTASALPEAPAISAIQKLDRCEWWTNERQSVHLARRTEEFLQILRPILGKANSLMFIDPYLDPSRPQYSEFVRIATAAARQDDCPPRIEIHRLRSTGHSPRDIVPSVAEWKERFRDLNEALRDARLGAEVFLWDRFHDRYLITDVIGLVLSNGFDRAKNPDETTTWARVGREVRTKIEREFDSENSPCHRAPDTFQLGYAKS